MENKPPADIDGAYAPHGPQVIEVPIPGGAFEPAFPIEPEPRPTHPDKTWADVVDEKHVLCFDCRYGWIMWKHAPTRNLKPDGSPYIMREGYCLFPAQNPGGAPLPLDSRFVLRCNVYEASSDPNAARATAQQPHASGDDINEPDWAGKPNAPESETPHQHTTANTPATWEIFADAIGSGEKAVLTCDQCGEEYLFPNPDPDEESE